MPVYIKDEEVTRLVRSLAESLGTTKRDAVKRAVEEKIAREALRAVQPGGRLRDRLAARRAARPLPPPTGEVADKAFFDELSGEM
jgi:antitoxin VapB